MKKLPDLKQLSDEAKNALIVELWQEIQKLRAALDTLRIKTQLISRQNQLEFQHSTIKKIQAQHQALAIENRRS
jgi:uncharacterized coiled-coil protein SlyX